MEGLKNAMAEKRNYPRLDVKLPVTLRYKGRLIPATMLNLSCGGMCVKAEGVELAGDAKVEVVFDLDENKKDISINGRVMHVVNDDSSSTMGLRFTNIFSLSRKAIAEYLGENLN